VTSRLDGVSFDASTDNKIKSRSELSSRASQIVYWLTNNNNKPVGGELGRALLNFRRPTRPIAIFNGNKVIATLLTAHLKHDVALPCKMIVVTNKDIFILKTTHSTSVLTNKMSANDEVQMQVTIQRLRNVPPYARTQA